MVLFSWKETNQSCGGKRTEHGFYLIVLKYFTQHKNRDNKYGNKIGIVGICEFQKKSILKSFSVFSEPVKSSASLTEMFV